MINLKLNLVVNKMTKIRILSRYTKDFQVGEFEIIEDIDIENKEESEKKISELQEFVHNKAEIQLGLKINPKQPEPKQEVKQESKTDEPMRI